MRIERWLPCVQARIQGPRWVDRGPKPRGLVAVRVRGKIISTQLPRVEYLAYSGTTVALLALVTATPRARHPREKASSFPPLGGLEVTNVLKPRSLTQSPQPGEEKRAILVLLQRDRRNRGVISAWTDSCAYYSSSTTGCARAGRIVDPTAAHGPVRSPGDLVHCIQRGWVPQRCSIKTRGGDRGGAGEGVQTPATATTDHRRVMTRVFAPHLFGRFGETVVPIGRFYTENRFNYQHAQG